MKTLQQAAEALFPRSRVREFGPYWPGVESYADLTTPQRKAMFLAQIGHECGGFMRFEENLNYSPAGLLKTFGPHRITAQQASEFGRTPQHRANQREIANCVYGGAWGAKNLGNTHPGDGWTYRGRGPKQITGRYNYTKANQTIGQRFGVDLVGDPDLLQTPKIGIYAAADFWQSHGLSDLTDSRQYDRVTKTVNGGLNGHAERMALYAAALKLLA